MSQQIEPLVQHYPLFVSSSVPAREAARIFSENNVDMLPVVNEFGVLRGVIYRSDILGYLTMSLRPASVGGMATPLGVYLTTGSISGGAGSIGLYLSGIVLGLMMILSKFASDYALQYILKFASPRFPIWPFAETIAALLSIGVLVLLLRLSPLAGYHAAEHMTVHAIEAGEDLKPESVRPMPRVHPRCGTNILAGAMIFMLITSRFGSDMAVLLAMVVLIVGWRSVGNWMQAFFTTKPPSDSQLMSGIAAGKEVLKRYHERPNYQAYGFRRMWNMGFLQAAAGMTTVLMVVYMLEKLFHLRILF
jgi:CBS domain-containing protein